MMTWFDVTKGSVCDDYRTWNIYASICSGIMNQAKLQRYNKNKQNDTGFPSFQRLYTKEGYEMTKTRINH